MRCRRDTHAHFTEVPAGGELVTGGDRVYAIELHDGSDDVRWSIGRVVGSGTHWIALVIGLDHWTPAFPSRGSLAEALLMVRGEHARWRWKPCRLPRPGRWTTPTPRGAEPMTSGNIDPADDTGAAPAVAPPYRYTVVGLVDGDAGELLVAAVFDGEHPRVDVGKTPGYERVALLVDADNRVQAERFAAILAATGGLPEQESADRIEPGDTVVHTLTTPRAGHDDPREADTSEVDRVGRTPDDDVLLWLDEDDTPTQHDPSEQLWIVKGT
ncbi:hypothetical protein [Saccharothrix sp. HUAS TT1]|uniref:hypothetical protein n=1 Tax=unclassified Saccharothrix TaxID=2593673 RepID=UPI00345C1E9D